MIREIFLPEKVGSYYVFPQKIVACEITRSHVRMTSVKAQGNTKVIEKILERPILNDLTLSYQDRVANLLNDMIQAFGSYDMFYLVLPGNLVITKELTVPFSNPDKIKLILPFEIEPLLPFPLADATIDCIITQTTPDASTVLAVAIKNDILTEQLSILEKAHIHPQRVSVDLIELYALYKALNKESKQNAVLLYIGLHTTRLGIVTAGQLKTIRVLPQGTLRLAKLLGQDHDAMIHTGFDDHLPDIVGQAEPFFSDVLFTLQSVASKLPEDQSFNKILLFGTSVDIKGFSKLISEITHLPCETIQANAILQNSLATMGENHGIPNSSIIPTSTALSLTTSEDFNLYKAPEQIAEEKVFTRQFIAACILALGMIGSLLAYGFYSSRKLKQEIADSEKESIGILKKEFPMLSSRYGTTGLDAVKNAARGEVAREKSIWFALSTQNRASFLHYLQELFTRLDAVGLGLNLSRLTLTEDTLTLEGSVKDYEALKQLEEDLRQSKLFNNVPRLQELKFSAKITLDKTYGEG
jgi:Tfp pilus assembly PilM family ATPase